jgi:glycosyltransferase involved in cell wall biosynthesis
MNGFDGSEIKNAIEPVFDLIFITAAEPPSVAGLHASQVLEPAIFMAKCGHRVTWLAAVPLFSYLEDMVLFRGRIRSVQDRCAKEGIHFEFVVAPITIGGSLSFLFRHLTLRWAANRLVTLMRPQEGRRRVLHARSYYAAHLACEIKSIAKLEEAWRVSFDMRSVLPEEFPMAHGFLGKARFGFAKQWEHELLGKSDVSFLPLEYARERISRESGCEVVFAPIQGFDRAPDWSVDFEQRWANRYMGYAGSISTWHDPVILLEMLASIPGSHPRLAAPPHPLLEGLSCETYEHHEMAAYYDGLLGLVIPGRKDLEDYFISFKMRCNFFSTKAAEALSRGVPLVVSSKLTELAEFVRQHECGAVYDIDKRQIVFPEGNWLESKSEWLRLSENATNVGEMFTRRRVMELYQSEWNSLFEVPSAN